MANRTHVCKYCKKRSEEAKKFGLSYFCDSDCAMKYSIEKSRKDKVKQDKAEFKARKKKFKDNDMRTRRRAVKEACHAYIRYRDRNDACICCDRPLGETYDAGHHFESGNNPRIRYDENNIHGQTTYCNRYKGGDSGSYKENLIKKIGVFEYYCLEHKKGGYDKLTAQDLKAIELYYKAKLKELKRHCQND